MQSYDLLLTLAGGLGAALVFGYATQRIGLSPIVGYLIAGLAVGPATPGFVANRALAEQLAEVGVILLMFGVGLQFHFKELLRVKGIAVPGAVFQILAATLLGALSVSFMGWGWNAGIVHGLAISVASTVVLVRVLSDRGHLHTQTGHIAVGWLVVEDLFTILALVLLPLAFSPRAGDAGGMALGIILAVVKIGVLIGFIMVVGGRVLPWLLARVAATRSRELFTLTILVVALGISIGAAKVFGASMALGAFLAGMVVGRSEFSLRAASEALPMRDAFAVLFFVSIGMLFHPEFVVESPLIIVLTLLIVMVGKPLAAIAITLIRGYSLRIALAVAAALAQIGEFSFILAALAISLGILPSEALDILVAVAIVSISLNPLIYRSVQPLERWLRRKPMFAGIAGRGGPSSDSDGLIADAETFDSSHRAVIVGYGPVGQTLARILAEEGVEPVIIEMNLETVQLLRAQGTKVHYGDATLRTTLERAGVQTAGTFVLAVSALREAEEMIRMVRDLNPRIRVLARATYVSEKTTLKKAGADVVFSGEGEVALSMAVSVLEELGATPEQIDRERSRVRQDIL